MARPKTTSLPRFLSFHHPNRTYYYKNPDIGHKANLGKIATMPSGSRWR